MEDNPPETLLLPLLSRRPRLRCSQKDPLPPPWPPRCSLKSSPLTTSGLSLSGRPRSPGRSWELQAESNRPRTKPSIKTRIGAKPTVKSRLGTKFSARERLHPKVSVSSPPPVTTTISSCSSSPSTIILLSSVPVSTLAPSSPPSTSDWTGPPAPSGGSTCNSNSNSNSKKCACALTREPVEVAVIVQLSSLAHQP